MQQHSKSIIAGRSILMAACLTLTGHSAASQSINEIKVDELRKKMQMQMQSQYGSLADIDTKAISQQSMNEAISRARILATEEGAFKLHQISKYCQPEIVNLCNGRDINDPMLTVCLAQNQQKLSKQCRTVTSDENLGPPTHGDAYFNDVLIPAKSRYFHDPADRSIGVKLSRPTAYSGLNIKSEISWYDGGNIKSFIPTTSPVQYGNKIFSPGYKLAFFPTGEVKEGVLDSPVNIGGVNFYQGQKIARNTPRSQWYAVP